MQLIKQTEFFSYVLIGALATGIDWVVFSTTVNGYGLQYQLGLILAFTSGSITHYTLNRLFTFQCRRKALALHLPVYVLTVCLSLACSLGVLTGLVWLLPVNKIYLRMLTTGLLILPNYLFHKNFSFNKALFTRS